MYIDDCIVGTKKIFETETNEVYNLGSDEQVSINQMLDIIQDIANYKIEKNYQLEKPKGVRGRSSDNTKIFNDIKWAPSIKLKEGLTKTYEWVYNQITSRGNDSKFTRAY